MASSGGRARGHHGHAVTEFFNTYRTTMCRPRPKRVLQHELRRHNGHAVTEFFPLYVNLVRFALRHLLSRGRGRNQIWQVVKDEHEAIMAML